MTLLGIALCVGLAYGISRTGSEVENSSGSKEITPSPSDAVLGSEEGKGPANIDNTFLSKVILNVEGMSCGGCEATIKSSLSDMKGIRNVSVDVSAGKTTVVYDSRQLTDADQIAKAVTASGYPARIWKNLSPDQIEAEQARAIKMSRDYVASVGGRNISRYDYDDELETLKRRVTKLYGEEVFSGDRGKSAMDRLKTQVISGLINESVLLQEIDKAGYRLDPQVIQDELDLLIEKHGGNLDEFRKAVQENGYEFDTFVKKFEKRILIDKYVDEKILADVLGKYEKQRAYSIWYQNVRALVVIEYFDKELESLTKNQTAGRSCCSAG
jgi:copper chaperone CopZ